MLLNHVRDASGGAGTLCQAAIQIDEPVSVRFKAGTHGIPGINCQLPRAVRDHLPHPELLILRSNMFRNTHSGSALSGLQFANPKSLAQAMSGGTREVQSGRQFAI